MSTGSSSRKSRKKRPEKKRVEERPALSTYLKSALACGLVFCVPLAIILFYALALIMGMPVLLRDTLVLQGYILVLSLVIFTLFAFILYLPGVAVDRLLEKKNKKYPAAVIYTVLFSIPTVFLMLLSLWVVLDKPFDFSTPWLYPAILLFCLAGFGVGVLLKDIALGLRKILKGSGTGRVLRIAILWLAVPIAASAVVKVGMLLKGEEVGEVSVTSTLRENTDTRLVVIGLDGATPDILDEMIAGGKLPNIKYLIDNGSYGHLKSNVSVTQAFASSASMGMRSPALWESVATGKTEKKHGIFDFSVMRIPFMKSDFPFRIPLLGDIFETIPTTSSVGKSLRFWEILSRSGLPVGVIGWWNMWPLTPVENGYVVSSRVQWGTEGNVYPPDLLQEYAIDRLFTEDKAAKLFMNRWEGLGWESLLSIIESSDASLNFDAFKRHFKRDNMLAALSLHLLTKNPAPLFATYFQGPDFACHLFWKYMEPALFVDVREQDARLFGEIIPRYYTFLDDIVGKHIEADSLDVTYMILSDHGFGSWSEGSGSVLGSLYHPTYNGKHGENGIIILAGKNIRRGAQFEDPVLFDVAPTILTLFGMPVAIDMDGRPLLEAIDDGFLAEHPVRYVNTYETGEKKISAAVTSDVDDEIKDRLRALGYME